MRLILASQSPRRHQLMTAAGFEFETVLPGPNAECGVCAGESTPELVARLAFQKAKDVAARVDFPATIIACDTVADVMGQVLGKPRDRDHAEQMIRLLCGRRHSVYSGLCLQQLPNGEPKVQVERSELFMKELSEEQLQEYLDSEDWEGKSGAFGYQDGHPWLELVSGTADNVVGLPMDLLRRMLSELESE
ncbi:MAG: Maf family protein [Planctomycetota bacterium]